jgi:hypothetical protein
MIDQLTVFLENKEGHLAAMCRCLGDAGINMTALTIAETSEYGLVRILCSDPHKAAEALDAGGYRATVSPVMAISMPDRPGALADLLETFDGLGFNVEYGYCFLTKDNRAADIFKVGSEADSAEVTFKLEEAGFKVLSAEDLA